MQHPKNESGESEMWNSVVRCILAFAIAAICTKVAFTADNLMQAAKWQAVERIYQTVDKNGVY